jgi:hypothetical protein
MKQCWQGTRHNAYSAHLLAFIVVWSGHLVHAVSGDVLIGHATTIVNVACRQDLVVAL